MDYRDFVRPKYVDLMIALGMNCKFHKAEGSYLFYMNKNNEEVRVDDFLGGYGAALFGHNDPEFIDHMINCLKSNIPFHAQLSVREKAGILARKLDEAINCELQIGDKLISTFSNSGAESVEVAIKHAEYARHKEITKQYEKIEHEISLIPPDLFFKKIYTSDVCIPDCLFNRNAPFFTVKQIIDAIKSFNLNKLYDSPIFFAIKKSFHGKLVSSVQLTHNKQYRESFSRFGLKTVFINPDNVNHELKNHKEDNVSYFLNLSIKNNCLKIDKIPFRIISGFLLEPIQGEGGINEYDDSFYKAVRRFCNEMTCPLIIDEIQCGFGRTGKLLASSHFNLKGDYYCLSKALGGGLVKIAVTMIKESHYVNDFSYIHSSTFAEDDLSCEIAIKSLERLLSDDNKFLSDVADKGIYLKNALVKLKDKYPDLVKDVRGRGLLVGLELSDLSKSQSMILSSTQYNDALGYMCAGYLLNNESVRVAPSASNSNVIRLEPPACISYEQIDRLKSAIDNLLDSIERNDAIPFAASICSDIMATPLKRNTIFNEHKLVNTNKGYPIVAKVAFINHLIDSEMLSDVDDSLSSMNSAEKDLFIKRMKPERKAGPIGPFIIQSSQGVAVEFTLYPLCMNSKDMTDYLLSGDLSEIRNEIDERIKDAREDGCSVAGLGMYTSIVTNNCQSILADNIAVTSGNSLTIGMGLRAIETACKNIGLDLREQTAVVVGAAGNIASTYAALLSENVKELILLGSAKEGSINRLLKTAYSIYSDAAKSIRSNNLQDDLLAQRLNIIDSVREIAFKSDYKNIGKEIYEIVNDLFGESSFIKVSNNLDDIKKAKIILCAANSPESFLSEDNFSEGSVVCDIAVPLNVNKSIHDNKKNIVYMHGGIVKTPFEDSLASNVRAYLKKGQLYACMAESVLMGLSGMHKNYSYGDISREQVRRIMAIADSHGFSLADYKCESSL